MKLLAALLTTVALVGALTLKLAYLYPILGVLALALFLMLDQEHHYLGLVLAVEGFVFGALGYGANTLVGLRVGYADLLLLSLAVVALVRLAITRHAIPGQFLPLTLFGVWILLFAGNVAIHPEVLESGLSRFQLFCVDPFLIYVVGTVSLDSRERVEQAVITLALVALPLGLMIAGNWLAVGLTSEDAVLDAGTLKEAAAESTFMFRNKNIGAAVFAALAPLFLGAAGSLKSWLGRLACGTAALVAGAVVAFSLSRGSLTALLVGLLVFWLLGVRSRKTFLLAGLAFMGLATLALEQVGVLEALLRRFEEEADVNRLELLWASLGMIRDYPLTGIGMSEFSFLETLYFYSRGDVNLVHPHNSFLQMAVFGGLPLAAAFLGLLGVLLSNSRQLRHHEAGERRLQAAVLAGTLAFLVNMLTDFIYFNSITCFTFWFLLTMLSSRGLWLNRATPVDRATG